MVIGVGFYRYLTITSQLPEFPFYKQSTTFLSDNCQPTTVKLKSSPAQTRTGDPYIISVVL